MFTPLLHCETQKLVTNVAVLHAGLSLSQTTHARKNGTELIEVCSLCHSAVVSFVCAVIRSCYSTKFPQHRARGQSVVQVLNCALRLSSLFAEFISVQLLCKVPRSS